MRIGTTAWGMLAAVAMAGGVSACGEMPAALEPGEVEGAAATATGDDKTDGLYGAATYTYYSARRDFRRCAYPMCGGWWIKRVNVSTTRCVDGTYATECYVPELSLTRLGSAAERFDPSLGLMRGAISAITINGNTWGKFVASEGWAGSSGTKPIAGTFRRLQDNGVRCITFPCFSTHAARLNQSYHSNVSGVDLSQTGASRREIDAALSTVATPRGEGILAVGSIYSVPNAGPAGRGYTFKATQFYTRAR